MELVDDEDVETMTDVVDGNGYDSSDPSDHEADSDSDLDVDNVLDDIDDECVNDDRNVYVFSVGNQIQRIVIHNNLGAHMFFIDPDTIDTAEFSEYLDILPAHRLAVDSDLKELFVCQRFKKWGINVFVENVRDVIVANRRIARSMNVRFSTRHYPCTHVVAASAKVSLNMPPTTFENILDKGLRRNPKGRPQSSRIYNEMDIREKSDRKLCGVCRLVGYNRNEKSYASNTIDELEPGGLEYCGGYGSGGVEYCGGCEQGGVENCGGSGLKISNSECYNE
ncbi:hypothetical protein GOBAR_DD11781 [Gossypium barbadense]|nr:hypothetical protein GOBAR_DD11781 [Gossypium barbadense]